MRTIQDYGSSFVVVYTFSLVSSYSYHCTQTILEQLTNSDTHLLSQSWRIFAKLSFSLLSIMRHNKAELSLVSYPLASRPQFYQNNLS